MLPSGGKKIVLTTVINLCFEGVVSSYNIQRTKELQDHAFVVESVGAGAFGELDITRVVQQDYAVAPVDCSNTCYFHYSKEYPIPNQVLRR